MFNPRFNQHLAALALLLAGLAAAGASAPPPVVVEFNGTRLNLANPLRGFRFECTLGDPPAGPASPKGVPAEIALAQAANASVIFTYTYLDVGGNGTNLTHAPLDGAKLRWIERDLAALEAARVQAVMVFSYLRGNSRAQYDNLPTVLGHLKQLAPLMQRYEGAVAALVSGFCGEYGESSTADCTPSVENTILLAQRAELLPPGLPLLVRKPAYKRQLWEGQPDRLSGGVTLPNDGAYAGPVGSLEPPHSNTLASTVGFWNAKFAPGIAENMWPLPGACDSTSECEPAPFFDYISVEAPFVFLDGEMYSHDKSGNVTALNATLRMRTHHYTTFSLVHSNGAYDGGSVIDAWQRAPLAQTTAAAHQLPQSNGYFDGRAAPPSHFEFMRDHMGYRYELQRLHVSRPSASAASGIALSLELINRGFDVLHRRCAVDLLLLQPGTGAVVATQPVADADPRTWQPYVPGDPARAPLTFVLNATFAAPASPLDVGLRITIVTFSGAVLPTPLYLRVANDVPWDVATGISTLARLSLDHD